MMRSFVLAVMLCTPACSLRLAQYEVEDPPEGLELYSRRVVKEGLLPDKKLEDDEYYLELRNFIKKSCGSTCQFSPPSEHGKFYGKVSKPDNCATLFSDDMMALDGLSNRLPPPTEVPKIMRKDFGMGDENMPIEAWYIDDTTLASGEKTKRLKRWQAKWAKDRVEAAIGRIQGGDFHTGYSIPETKAIHQALELYKSELEGKHCAVIGSQRPWLEVLLLSVGVKNITTIEYTDLTSSHPQLDSLHPSDWSKLYAKGHMYDCIATYSSLEHAGLGRYGDILNPWGDAISMAKAKCMTKPGGLILAGWPMAEVDKIAWNAHRYYGPKRWAEMLADTEQLHKQDGWQGFVLARKL